MLFVYIVTLFVFYKPDIGRCYSIFKRDLFFIKETFCQVPRADLQSTVERKFIVLVTFSLINAVFIALHLLSDTMSGTGGIFISGAVIPHGPEKLPILAC